MIDYERFLKNNPNGVLATFDGRQVRARIMKCLFTEGNKAYFCTSTKKGVHAQLLQNPGVTFCTHQPDYGQVLSLNGTVEFCDDPVLKKRLLDQDLLLRDLYGSADNPSFVLFYLFIEEVEMASLADGVRKCHLLGNYSLVKPAGA